MPSHPYGPKCSPHTFRAPCRYCGEPIFVHVCNCGSKVLFESLGPPWPKHHCRVYHLPHWQAPKEHRVDLTEPQIEQILAISDHLIELAKDIQREFQRIQGIQEAWLEEIRIEEEHARKITEQHQKYIQQQPIKRCRPSPGVEVPDIGVVREVIPLDVYKKYKLRPQEPSTAKLLGELATNDFVQVTVHAGDLSVEQMGSYTFFVKKKDWDKIGAIRGDVLSFVVKGKEIPRGEEYWLCTDIRWV